jgi:DNA polymerase-3 subunit epsilon
MEQYAIIDIETTGGRAERDKITEIAIVLHNGKEIIDSFETLINPECTIPYGITELTGITQEMVAEAPKFYEIAKKVVEMTEGAIFVAHNVRFDYSFVQQEFRRLGYTYTRKQLCTVRLARKTFPGLRSYSLSSLIDNLGLHISNRHRAMGDTLATVELFEKIMAGNQTNSEIKSMINLGLKESLMPKNFSLEKLHTLPEECGVYYFHDSDGQVVYIGKSINIKKRIAEHFKDRTEKGKHLQKMVEDVTWEITGSELIALLLESSEIKRIQPPINRAQKAWQFPYIIHQYTNQNGYICFDVRKTTAKSRLQLNVIAEFPKLSHAKGWLSEIKSRFELCLKLCHIDTGNGACFDYHLNKCYGACIGIEAPAEYNQRAEQAKAAMDSSFIDPNFILIDRGRNSEEKAVVLVENGVYKGYGYANLQELNGYTDELFDVIRKKEDNPEIRRILRRFLGDNQQIKKLKF